MLCSDTPEGDHSTFMWSATDLRNVLCRRQKARFTNLGFYNEQHLLWRCKEPTSDTQVFPLTQHPQPMETGLVSVADWMQLLFSRKENENVRLMGAHIPRFHFSLKHCRSGDFEAGYQQVPLHLKMNTLQLTLPCTEVIPAMNWIMMLKVRMNGPLPTREGNKPDCPENTSDNQPNSRCQQKH